MRKWQRQTNIASQRNAKDGKILSLVLTVGFCLTLLNACEREPASVSPHKPVLSVWAHAGQADERAVLEQQLARFRNRNPEIPVELTFLPERTYNAQVQAAAVAGELPDVLEIDGPYLANYVWQGHLHALDKLISPTLQQNLLPSIVKQGTYRKTLYGVGTFDSGLALYARKSMLEKAGVTQFPQHPKQAWKIAEFHTLLATLSQQDSDAAVLDLKLNYPDEWISYAFSPMLLSSGGGLIERNNYQNTRGILNSDATIQVLKTIQSWLQNNWIDPNLDDAAFTTGRVALSLSGHWEYRRYHTKWGDDLVLLPLPDFGKGSRSGQGSWLWSVTKKTQQAESAAALLQFLLRDEEILSMTNANTAVPATRSAIEKSALYGKSGPLRLFAVQLAEGYTQPRPQTPAYPVISSAFRQAFADIRNGGDIQSALDKAVGMIDRDIKDNKGYKDP